MLVVGTSRWPVCPGKISRINRGMKPNLMKNEKCPNIPSIPALSATRRPGEGFYDYVNQNWLNQTHLPQWRSEYSVSDEIEDETENELISILQGLKQTKAPPNPAKRPEDHLRWLSHIWHSSIPEKEEAYIKAWLSQIVQAKSRDELSNVLGQMMRYRMSTIFSLEIQEAIRPPFVLFQSFVSGNLVLPNVYYSEAEYQKGPVWAAYENLVGILAVEYGLPFLLHAIDAEKAVAKILDMPFAVVMKSVKGSQFPKLCPGLCWDALMAGLGFENHWHLRSYLLDAPERIQKLIAWFTDAPIQEVAGLLALHVLVFAAPYLRPAVKTAADDLFQKALRGVQGTPKRDIQFLQDVKLILPDAMGYLYAKAAGDSTTEKKVREMAESIRSSAIQVMRSTKVFSKRTKSKAIEKLRRIKILIGNVESKDALQVQYDEDSLLHSFFSVLEARTQSQLRYVGKPASLESLSGYPSFAANASYYSESNIIMIPWGILKWPMFCKDASLAWNYGGIGAILAHEITHAFDMEGRFYNEKAVYKQWWTRRNIQKFDKATRKVQKFYGSFKHLGISVDGRRTLSENWADLGGCGIALAALKSHLSGTLGPEELREVYKDFFISYAVSWRTLIRRQKMVYSMLTSVHAQSVDRVDRIVPQFQEWVDAFQIHETDSLYLKPSDRLKFF